MSCEKNLTTILEGVDESFRELLKGLLTNPRNTLDSQKVIELTHHGNDDQDHQVVSLYLGEKYAQFYDEFTQTAFFIPELRPLVDYIFDEQHGWNHNLD